MHALMDPKIPTSPGQRAYRDIVSEHAESGAVQPREARLLAHANRTSTGDGLNMLFPSDALKLYLNHSLSVFDFEQDPDGTDTRQYGSTHVMPLLLPCRTGNKSDPTSLIDINRDFEGAQSVFDHSIPNRNLGNSDLLRAYEFMEAHPEYGLAVKWLAGSVTDFSRELKKQLEENPAFLKLKDSGIIETLDILAHDEGLALMDGRFTVAAIAAITHATGIDKNGIAREPDNDHIKAMIQALKEPNIFKQQRVAQNGEAYTGLCPATRFNIGILSLDLGGDGRSENMALTSFIKKIKDVMAGGDPHATPENAETVKTICRQFSDKMHERLNTPEALEAKSEMSQWKAGGFQKSTSGLTF